jgi:hypothetical protein
VHGRDSLCKLPYTAALRYTYTPALRIGVQVYVRRCTACTTVHLHRLLGGVRWGLFTPAGGKWNRTYRPLYSLSLPTSLPLPLPLILFLSRVSVGGGGGWRRGLWTPRGGCAQRPAAPPPSDTRERKRMRGRERESPRATTREGGGVGGSGPSLYTPALQYMVHVHAARSSVLKSGRVRCTYTPAVQHL